MVFALGLETEAEAGRGFRDSTSEYFSGAYFRTSESFRPPVEDEALAFLDLRTLSRCLCSENYEIIDFFWGKKS